MAATRPRWGSSGTARARGSRTARSPVSRWRASTLPAVPGRIEDMRITGNGKKGVYLDGEYGRLLHGTITDNVQSGINCRWTCLVEGNMISGNGGGVSVYAGTVLGNAIVKNKSY